MRYAVPFLLLAALFAYAAVTQRGLGWFWLWPSLSFLLAGVAYAGGGPRLFGKRRDGSLPIWSLVAYLPYYAGLWSLWHLVRLVTPLAHSSELLPGVLIGRRLLPSEVPDDVTLVVDLTVGFPEPRGVRHGREYLSLPILDAQAPRSEQLSELLDRLDQHAGTVYVHCAEGYGRAGLVAAALLLRRGLAADPEDALRQVRARRHEVRLSRAQRDLLNRWADQR